MMTTARILTFLICLTSYIPAEQKPPTVFCRGFFAVWRQLILAASAVVVTATTTAATIVTGSSKTVVASTADE